jgi:hypothetical protein
LTCLTLPPEIPQEMAARLGHEMTNKNVSKYERTRSVPPIEVVLAYARVANVIMEQIVDDDLDLRFRHA